MPLNQRDLHKKLAKKKKRRIDRKLKKEKKLFLKLTDSFPVSSKGFNKCAWNNTITHRPKNVLKNKTIGFNKQAWNDDRA